MLVLYYFAYPPFGISLLLDTHEGSVFVVDKLLVEACALAFIAVYKEQGYGLDALIRHWKKKKKGDTAEIPPREVVLPELKTRREMLKNFISLPVLAGLGGGAYWSNKVYSMDVMSGATVQLNRVALNGLKGELPKGKLGNHQISRLVMGGNLIGGWSHGRDLRYTDQLFKAYNTEKKIFETLMLCEQAGINTINIGFPTIAVMAKYKKLTGSKINVVTQIAIRENSEDIFDNVTTAVDSGIDIIQLNGEWTDKLVRENRIHIIAKLMERIRKEGCTAGLGAHDVNSLFACEEYGIVPDYYMKTMHHHNYWSVKNHSNTFHDNVLCLNPDRTIEFVNRSKVPVMGFKVLAAGAIAPNDGFRWAFENGADFICVGMFDFQVVDDINICLDTLQHLENRKREWFA
jgi:phosphoheptose isomerase